MQRSFRKERKFSKLSNESKDWREVPIGRICFRGDTRPPAEFLRTPLVYFNPASLAAPTISAIQHFADDSTPIGQVGFQPKPGGPAVPQYKLKTVKGDTDKVFRHHSREKMEALRGNVIGAGDISEGGVCVTTDFHIAPLFPFKTMDLFTWIYMVIVESGYDTHGRQCLDSLEVLRRMRKGDKSLGRNRGMQHATSSSGFISEEDAGSVMATLYGQELVVTSIPSTHVIAAVRCWRDARDFRSGAYKTEGVAYELREEMWINPVCKHAADMGLIDPVMRGKALQFFIDESIQNTRGRTPAISDGFGKTLI